MKLFILSLGFLCSTLLWSPISFAAAAKEPTNKLNVCKFNNELNLEQAALTLNADKSNKSSYEQTVNNVRNAINTGTGTCGKVNNTSGYYEMIDCTKKGFSLVEVREIFGSNVAEKKTDEDNKFIMTVYAGSCCIGFDSAANCIEPLTVYADTQDACVKKGNQFCSARQWIISKGGMGLLTLYLRQIFIFMTGFSGFIAVVVIIISGIQIQYSGASGDITQYKDRIIRSLSGIVLLFVSSLILIAVNPDFFR